MRSRIDDFSYEDYLAYWSFFNLKKQDIYPLEAYQTMGFYTMMVYFPYSQFTANIYQSPEAKKVFSKWLDGVANDVEKKDFFYDYLIVPNFWIRNNVSYGKKLYSNEEFSLFKSS